MTNTRTEENMDTDAYTCGQCKHGNFHDQCGKCEDDYERQRKARITKQKLGEAWAPWMDKKPYTLERAQPNV